MSSQTGFYFGNLCRNTSYSGTLDSFSPRAISAHVALSTTSHHCGRSGEGSGAAGPGSHSSLVHIHEIQVVSVSLLTSSLARTLLRGHITRALWERRRENFWLLLRVIFFYYHISVTLEVEPVYCKRGCYRYSFPSPCVWAPLSRSMWKVSGSSSY